MPLSNPSLSWQKLSDIYYSIRPCYDTLSWDLEDIYSNHKYAVSKSATLIALASRFVPHPNVITIYSLSGTKLWTLVYNSGVSGTNDHIVDFQFCGEYLCVVLANSKVRVYTDFLGTFDEYSCKEDAVEMTSKEKAKPRSSDSNTESRTPSKDEFKYVITNLEDNSTEEASHIVETYAWGSYLVLRYIDHMTFVNLADYAVYDMPFPSLRPADIHSVCLISADAHSLSFIMSYESTVYTVQCDFGQVQYDFSDENLTDGPFTMISASADGRFVSLLNAKTSKIFVTTQGFDAMLLEYDTSNESSLPFSMKWAGNDAIVLSLRDEIKLIGPGQKSISFFYDIEEDENFDFEKLVSGHADAAMTFTIPIIETDVDGLKIITKNKVEFLSRVPHASVALHSVGSTDPASILLDCVDKLAHQASKADSNISLLESEGSLITAIDGCLRAALEEFSPDLQKAILKAASFGKIYVAEGYNAHKYVQVLNTLKVFNQLRSPEIALFLTNFQIIEIGWPTVIDMLLMRSLHLLALTIVDLLDLGDCRPKIYVHWCCMRIRHDRKLADIDLFKVLAKRLLSASKTVESDGSKRNYISTAEIFNVALQEGRLDLCRLLVDIEPQTAQKIELLLKIDDPELALVKCFQSCDYDLCVSLLRQLKETLSPAKFQQVLNQNEAVGTLSAGSTEKLLEDDELRPFFQDNLFVSGDLISNVWLQSTAKYDDTLLEEFYRNGNKTHELNVHHLQAYSKQESDVQEPLMFAEVYQMRKKELSRLAGDKKLKSMVQTELDILDLRYRLSTTYQVSFFEERSVVDVMRRLIKMHQLKPAGKVARDFKISQQNLWNLVLETYCQSQDFERLDKFIEDANNGAAVYKSPIGFETIVETCLAYGCPSNYVSAYIGHCTESSYSQRAKLYMRNGDMSSAAEEAFKGRDEELLREIQQQLAPEHADVLDAIKTYINRLRA